MKSTIAATAALSLAAGAAAQEYNISSAPFQLVVNSAEGKYTNVSLDACHIGAAIEDLCITNETSSSAYTTYNFNTSASVTTYSTQYGEEGYITWVLPEDTISYSYPFGIYTYLSSNVGLPGFGLSDPTLVAFDPNGQLNIQSYLDDTVDPPTDDVTLTGYYRWYICENNFEGYIYESLSWVLGDQEPQNPSCTKVDVTRQFIS